MCVWLRHLFSGTKSAVETRSALISLCSSWILDRLQAIDMVQEEKVTVFPLARTISSPEEYRSLDTSHPLNLSCSVQFG